MKSAHVIWVLLALTLTLSGCVMIDQPPHGPPSQVISNEPGPAERQNHNKIEGEFCIIERIVPEKIKMNERFTVTVIIEAKQYVQSIYLEEDGWFREFRVIQEPISLWLKTGPGERRTFTYEVEMWLSPPESHLIMFGSAICNIGGLGESEVLRLESKLKVAAN